MSMTTPRVTVPVEDLLFYKLKDLILEQSEGEWTDEMIVRDAHHFANHIRPLLSAAPAPEGGAVSYAAWDVVRRVANLTVAGGDPLQDPAFAKYPAIADLVSKAQSALATREEAPAEAGEDVNWKAEYEAACAARISDRQKSQEVINERDKWVAELLQERAALRVQPPAREDAQPFMFAYEDVDKPGDWRAFRHQIRRTDGSICPGRALYTHPAPDALRVAVEALEKIERWHGEFPETGEFWLNDDKTPSERPISYGAAYGSNGERDFMRSVARQALSALQAEQKGGA